MSASGQPSTLDMPLRRGPLEPAPAETPGFETFLREHHHILLQFLRRRTASEQDAEDAAQESMARLLRYRESQPASSWRPLLFRIAANVAHDQSRHALSRQHKAHVAIDDCGMEAATIDTCSPERRLADRRQLTLVLHTIQRLPKKCRHVFLLSRFHGMSNQAIAERCSISVRMVEKQITKALAACRATMRDYGA